MTLIAARGDLATKITNAVADTSVTVLSYEPPVIAGDTITVATSGIRPDAWLLDIRIYVPAIQSAEGQDRIDTLTEAIDTYAGLQPVGRLDWALRLDEVKGAFFMEATAEYPREDF